MITFSSSSRPSNKFTQPRNDTSVARLRRNFRATLAALMASTALVGIAPHHALAADKIVDGVQETISTPQTFDNVNVGPTQPNSQLDIVAGGVLTISGDLTAAYGDQDATVTISGGGTASAGRLYLGSEGGVGTGTLTISGSGSKLSTTGNTNIGFDIGTGIMTLGDGGILEVANGLRVAQGAEANSTGTLNIGAAAGETATAAGIVQGAGGGATNISFGGGTGKIVFNHTDTDLDFNANVTGTGDIEVFSGTTILSGTNDIGDGAIIVEGGELKITGTTKADDLDVGKNPGSNGTVTISGNGSTLTVADRTYIGRNGNGTLNITNGGEAIFTRGPYLATGAGTTATITISGAGSKLTSAGLMTVGDVGAGVLTISDGGTATVRNMSVGTFDKTAQGTVTVSGAGSELTVFGATSKLDVGNTGIGTLSISEGGNVAVAASTFVGRDSSGSGTVTIAGNGSKLTSGEDIYVGHAGSGTLTITGGGEAASGQNVVLGKYSGSSGTATISGSGSKLTSTDDFFIGDRGTGTLTITGGGEAASGKNLILGNSSGSSGTVTVSGSGSKLTQTGANLTDIVVGVSGTGTLNVRDGGAVESNQRLIIARSPGSEGTVTVSGGGSKFTVAKNVYVANGSGSGSLSVLDGGKFETGGRLHVAESNDSQGTVTVSGTGSKLVATDGMRFGESGTGTLTVSDGGAVDGGDSVVIGNLSAGTATVSGSGSRLTATSELDVGKVGTGSLTVTDGGFVDTGGIFVIGKDSTGSGTVTISGAGSKIKNIFASYVGKDGKGTLTVSDGARFDGSEVVFLASSAGSVGTVTVTGVGSTIKGGLRIGDRGTGSLTLSHGGVAEGDGIVNIARFAGSTGTLNIGAASGDAAVAAGTIEGANGAAANLVFGAGAGKIVFNHTDADLDFNANVTGTGDIEIYSGITILSGTNDIGDGEIIAEGGELKINGTTKATFVTVGKGVGSNGTVTISGSGSKLTSTNYLDVGGRGTGTLNVTDAGAVASNNNMNIGYRSGSTGTVIISGSGSKATVLGNYLAVGDEGDGTLSISDGGEVAVDNLIYLGANSGASGTVTVSGSGSKLTSGNSIFVGNLGTGTLTVTDGGEAASGDDVIIGEKAVGSVVTVSGGGSKFTVAKNVYVANGSGSGSLSVLDGGKFETGGRLHVAESNDSQGTVTVSGTGSKLVATGGMQFGDAGTGTITVSDGGEVDGGDSVVIGNFSAGTATVSGSGSKLTATVELDVGKVGTGSLTVTNGGFVDTGGTFVIGKDSTGSGTVTISGAGSVVKNGFVTYVGKDGQGTLTISNGGRFYGSDAVFVGRSAGSVGTVTVTGAGSRFIGDMLIGESGIGALTLSNGGVNEEENAGDTLIARFAGSTGTLNIGAASGDAAIAAGMIQGANGTKASLVFGAGTGKLVFNHTETAYDFNAKVSGNGTVSQEAGFTNLTGDFSGFTGTGAVSGGTLAVNTAFVGAMNVLSGGTLTGSGSVGALDFATGSTYAFNFDGADALTSMGAVTIASGAKLAVEFADPKDVPIWKPTTVLSGTSVAGTFSTTNAATDYLFLEFGVTYTGTSVQVDVDRNNSAFASVASTPNEAAIANAIDGLPNGNDAYDTFATLKSASDARNAFNQLSGEAHASLQGGLLSGAGTTRDIVGSQIRSSFGGIAARTMDQTTTASVDRFEPVVKAIVDRAYDVWSHVYGAFGRSDGDGNSARTKRSTGGALFGAETGIGTDWRVGAFTGYGYTNTAVDDRKSSADTDSLTFGAFAGRLIGPARVQFGGSLSRHQISSSRDVAFAGFTDHLEADYAATTLQAFGEVGYAVWSDGFAFEPFAGAALVYQHTDAFTEKGGAAALSASASSSTVGITTIGVRTGFDYGRLANGTSVRLDGSLAWQHAFGDVNAQTTMAFASGSTPFAVSGTPLDIDTALIETGLTFGFENGMNLSLGYSGTIGKSAQDHTFTGRLKASF